MTTRKRDQTHSLMLVPYGSLFVFFILIPTALAIALSFTYFNTVEPPRFNGLDNYIQLITQDDVFMRSILPNTVKFALIIGPCGYALQFLLAWALAQIPKGPRTVLSLAFYSPSITSGVTMAVIWKVIFSGNQVGYINSFLLTMNLVDKPIDFLQSPQTLMGVMIFVTLWGFMGIGFLAMLGGILNINSEVYEAGYIDGVKNRFQEILYITIPSMKPQMMFGAVMAIVTTFGAGTIGSDLYGGNPTPQYAGSLMVNHIDDYGFLRYDMGYACAIAVALLLMIWVFSRIATKLFSEKEDG